MGLFGILLGLALLVWLAYRGWSILLLAPGAALIAAAFAGGPTLPYWTQTFMDNASRFVAQFFPLFLLGAVFGKLMEDSGSVAAIAEFMTKQLGPKRAILTVVLAGAFVTYGGVSLFVAFFVLVPMAQALFRTADIPNRLIPAAVFLGTSTFTMSALPGTPAIQNAIPMPFFGTTPLAAPTSASSRLRSCSPSACGGRDGLKAPPAAGARASVQSLRFPSTRRRRRRDGAPARHHGARVRSPRGPSRSPEPRGAADWHGGVAASRRGERQCADVVDRPAAPRRFVSRRGAVWRDIALRGGAFDPKRVAVIEVELQQRADDQGIHREPDRPAPVRVAAETSRCRTPPADTKRGIPDLLRGKHRAAVRGIWRGNGCHKG
jgi:hypothetical protein